MMDQNVYVAPDGKRYRAVEHEGCEGCSFIERAKCAISMSHGRASCIDRTDGRDIIWVPDDAPAPMAELTSDPAFPGTLRDWFMFSSLPTWVMAMTMRHDQPGYDDTAAAYEAARLAVRTADAMMKARDEARP